MPVYTVEDKIDGYIRNNYYGGRVEIFKFGLQPTGKYFYYDFTSLYPAMCLKDLPCGNPEFLDGSKIDISKFFGFVRCRVSTTDFSRKPIHAIYKDHKLLFPFLKDEEIVLFSVLTENQC